MEDSGLSSEKSNLTEDLTKEKLSKVMKESPHSEERENLKKWYSDYIDYFRKEYEKLFDDEKIGVNNTNNYLHPCQIEVFWIKNPTLQLIIQSNLSDRDDMEILIHGPFTTNQFIEKVKPVLNEPRWKREIEEPYFINLGSNHRTTYSESLARNLNRFIEYAKSTLFAPTRFSGDSGGTALNDKVWVKTYVGNIAETDYEKEINRLINSIKSEAKQKLEQKSQTLEQVQQKKRDVIQQKREPPKQNINEEKWDGFGVHLFPPVVIGKKSIPSVSQLLHGKTGFAWRERAFDVKIEDHVLIVNKDGFIFVESSHKAEAIRFFNVIMALGILDGLSLFAVREQDLSLVNYDKENLTITGQQWHSQTIRAQLHDFGRPQDFFLGYQIKEISEEQLLSIIKNTFKIKSNEKLVQDLRLFTEAYTHLENSEFAQSFIMSWSVIERNYSNLWRKKLDEKDLENERYSKLTNPAQWSIDYIFEALNLNGEIDDQEYDFLMELKRKRNRHYHSGAAASYEDAKRCLDFSTSLLRDKIKTI